MKTIVLLLLFTSFIQINSARADSCVFCNNKIIEQQAVFASEYFHVLIDYEPRVRGHLLVIPKRHIMKAHELSKEEWGELSAVIPKIVKVFSAFLETDQYIILEKNGRKAFQEVPHVHFHLFPIHSETWSEIFDRVPKQLSREDLEKEINLFRYYFLSSDC